MGLGCKPIGKFRGIMKKVENQLQKEKAELAKKKSDKKNADA